MEINSTHITAVADGQTSSALINFLSKNMNGKKKQMTYQVLRHGKMVDTLAQLKHYDLDEALEVTRNRIAENSKRYVDSHKKYLKILLKVEKAYHV